MEHKELFESAQHQFIKGMMSDSIESFSRAIESGEKTELAFLSRGVAYLRTRQMEQAIKDFSTALNMNNGNTRAHFYRGIAYMSNEQYKEAIKDFDKTIELQPGSGLAFFARGTAYAQIGDNSEAARNIKSALAYSEADIPELSDSTGLVMTQVDNTIMILTDKEMSHTMALSQEDIRKVLIWLEEDTYH